MVTALQLEEDTAASGANGASKGVAIPHHPWRKYPYSYLRCWWIFHAIDTPFIIFMVIWYIVVGIWGWIKTWIKPYQTSQPINWLAVWNMFYFYIYWECHHPNWRTHIFSEGLKSPTSKPVISWLVFWNMNFIFHFIYGIIPTPLMNSIIFKIVIAPPTREGWKIQEPKSGNSIPMIGTMIHHVIAEIEWFVKTTNQYHFISTISGWPSRSGQPRSATTQVGHVANGASPHSSLEAGLVTTV